MAEVAPMPWWQEVAYSHALGQELRTGHLRHHPDAKPSPHERELIRLVRDLRQQGGPDWSDCLPEPFRHLARD